MNYQELPARGQPLFRPLVCAVVCYPVWAPGCQPRLWAAARCHPTALAAGPSGFTPGAVRARSAPVRPRGRRGRSWAGHGGLWPPGPGRRPPPCPSVLGALGHVVVVSGV